MKIGIMQPYFFPYIGYISLIKYVDEFMLFDPVQFIHHGWIERNRIQKPFNKSIKVIPGENWQYISVPLLKHDRATKIRDIKINNEIDWRKKIIEQLNSYKKRAPYFKETLEVVAKGLNIETDSIVDLNENCLKEICNYLDIETKITIFSKENISIKEPKAADEWALNICLAKGNVNEYINPPGGQSFFDSEKYSAAGVDLYFLQNKLTSYIQKLGYFEPGLSIIDVMMFNSKEKINEMLNNVELLTKIKEEKVLCKK